MCRFKRFPESVHNTMGCAASLRSLALCSSCPSSIALLLNTGFPLPSAMPTLVFFGAQRQIIRFFLTVAHPANVVSSWLGTAREEIWLHRLRFLPVMVWMGNCSLHQRFCSSILFLYTRLFMYEKRRAWKTCAPI